MAQNISQLLKVTKKHSIILKWRTAHSDPCLVNSAHNVTNEDHEVIDSKERKEDQTVLIVKELEYLADQSGSQILEVMIFYGYKAC